MRLSVSFERLFSFKFNLICFSNESKDFFVKAYSDCLVDKSLLNLFSNFLRSFALIFKFFKIRFMKLSQTVPEKLIICFTI